MMDNLDNFYMCHFFASECIIIILHEIQEIFKETFKHKRYEGFFYSLGIATSCSSPYNSQVERYKLNVTMGQSG